MKYAYIDGDDIGLRIEKSLLTGDENGLQEVNQAVSSAINEISNYLRANNSNVIFSGADGVIFKANEIDVTQLQYLLKNLSTPLKFSVGIGSSLQESFIALRYAKACGKNGIAVFESELVWIKSPGE